MRKLLLTLSTVLLFSLTACGSQWDPVSATGVNELHILAETSRFAGLMGVKVRGEITDTPYLYGGQVATGWYQGGVAYYYRPHVEKLNNNGFAETTTNVACHEVCHAKNPHHDLAHWECMNKWAVPTYPRP